MTTLSRILTVGALLSLTILAQQPVRALPSSNPPDPATIVSHKVDHLTKLLGLNASQATQATTIFTNALTTVAPLEATLRTDRQSLTNAVKTNDLAAIDSFSTNVGSLTGQVLAIQNKADAAFYAILNPSQQQTLNESRTFQRGFGRGHGGPATGH